MKALPGDHVFTIDKPEGLFFVWKQILSSLRQSGFADVGAQYLKLSRLVRDSRHRQLLTGKSDNREQWSALSGLAREAADLLNPLLQAATILADLPMRIEAPLPAVSGKEDSTVSQEAKEAEGVDPIRVKSTRKTPGLPRNRAEASKPKSKRAKRSARKKAGVADTSPA